jgi:hypothetical protein
MGLLAPDSVRKVICLAVPTLVILGADTLALVHIFTGFE